MTPGQRAYEAYRKVMNRGCRSLGFAPVVTWAKLDKISEVAWESAARAVADDGKGETHGDD